MTFKKIPFPRKGMPKLFYKHPETRYLWNSDTNPYEINEESDLVLSWKCGMGHEFKRSVKDLIKDCTCPECVKDKRMLVSNPEAYKTWDYALNFINPDEEPLKQGETYHWRCEKGHKYTKKYQKVLQDPECKYCNMDLITDNPGMMKFWDKNKNNSLDPFYISSTNKEIPINWHCNNCGHEWQTAALIRKRSTGRCPSCNDDPKFSRQSIMLFEDNPALVRQYAGTKDVLKEPISLNEPLDWKCDDCGYEWSKPLRERFKSGNLKQCPNCRGRRFKNHIVDKYPEIRKLFSPNNIREVDSLTGNDYSNKFLWMCDKHGEYEQTLYIVLNEIEGKSIACPYCSGKLARREESIGYLYPELVKEYSSSNELDIYSVSPKSSKIAKWLCRNCGNEYSSSFKSRASGVGGYCKSCNFVDKPMKLLKDFRPDLEKYYNDTLNFNDLAYQSNKEPFWKCDNGHRFKFSVYAMTRHKEFYCPQCDTKVKRGVNDLETTDPDLAKEFSPNNIKKAYEYSKNNVASVLWICKECGNDYLYPINKRELNDKSCIYCYAGRVKTGYNDLATVDPELAKEYSPNNEKPASEIRRDSGYKVLWICPTCGHEYPFRVKDRTVGDNHCACCNGRKFKKGFNDLLTMYPNVAKEWSCKNDKKPDEVYYNSYYFAQFHCSECGDTYTAYVYDYYNNHEGVCPGCNDRRAVEGYNDLKTVYPELIKEWSKNNPPMEEVLYKNKTQYKWICQKCGGEYVDTIQNRLDGVDNCNVCTDLVVQKGINDLATTDPELAKEYSPNNVRKVYEIKRNHTGRTNWICPACNNEYQAAPRDREVGDNICPYCNEKKAIRGVNDLITLKPEIVSEFSLRNKKNPEDIIADSDNVYYWICPKCHGEYTYPVKDRYYGDDSCMYCNNRRVLPGFNDLATRKTDLLSEYSDENEKPASQILYTTVMPVLWKCPVCSGEYNYPVKDRELNDDACPYCNNRTILPGFNDLATLNPELAKEYSDKNEKPVTQIMGTMRSLVLWNCPTCHGEYSYPVGERKVNDNVCPYCNNKRVLTGFNDLATVKPELSKEYSDKNEKPATAILADMQTLVLWTCSTCHGDYYYAVKDRMLDDNACPYCNNKKVLQGYNDLGTLKPELVKEYSPKNNKDITEYTYLSTSNVLWVCPKCNGEYYYPINSREVNDSVCPYCNDKKVLPGFNDLATVDPLLAKEYSDKNNKSASEIRRTSPAIAIWQCPVCCGEYFYSIAERNVDDNSCPYCSDKKVLLGFNDLATVDPLLADEYSPNNEKGVDEVTLSSSYRANWICPRCNGEYSSPVKDRKVGDDSCPYCNDKKILKGYNDLATTHPQLIEEWCVIENLLFGVGSMSDYLCTSTKRVWWKCKDCGNKYKMSIADRVLKDKRHHKACDRCADRMRNRHMYM